MDSFIKREQHSPEAELIKSVTKEFKIEKSKCEEIKSSTKKDTLNNNIKSENDSDKIVRNKVLKRKLTEDGVVIERLLSEDGASSDLETVSSIHSNDIGSLDDDLELSSLNDCENKSEENFNVIVQIKNEFAHRNLSEHEERKYCRNDYGSAFRIHKRDVYSGGYIKRRLDNDRHSQKKSNENKYYKSNKRDKRSSEREITDNSRRLTCEHDSNTHDWNRKSRWSDHRSRYGRSAERMFRCRNSRSPERKVRCQTSSNKDRKAESRHSGSFDKSSSDPRRSSPVKKRRRSSRSPFSVWNRLDGHVNSALVKREKISTDKRNSGYARFSRKRERTPFLVELERKLKQLKQRSEKKSIPVHVTDTVPMPHTPTVVHQNPHLAHPLALPTVPVVQGMFHFQYQQMPTLSVDNLSLVPGPTGLPVHITITGEQIPHDMDGKRIPIGPNGFYLPVDPTGRLFPHIVSPANQAIPIHMTDDGVLRLPDSEPIPFGPCHQLPVNIDGKVIFVGPGSKALYPYPNLPREPPLNLLRGGDAGMQQTTWKRENQEVSHIQPQPGLSLQQPKIDLNLSDTNKNLPEENSEATPNKHRKMVQEKKNHIKYTAEKNLGVTPSKRGVKSPGRAKLLQDKAPKDEVGSGPEIIFDLSDLVPEVKSLMEFDKDSSKGVKMSPEDQGFVEIVCGNKSFTVQTNYLSSDDPILKKTEQAIKSLSEKNYKPPVFGRFIMSEFSSRLVAKKFSNESPLVRNRIKLPFVTPGAKDFYFERPLSLESAKVTFKFLPQKTEKGEGASRCRYDRLCGARTTKLPVFTFDFAMQCDFTSTVIKNLNSKVTELEAEVVRLRNVNANLLGDYRNAQARNENLSDELRKALLELQERNSEIQALKCSLK